MDKSGRNIRLGFFVILISVIFTYMIYRVSGGSGFINNNITVYANFHNVEGLLTGNNVRYSGIKVGTVSEIIVKSDSVLTVVMSLDRDVMKYVKTNSEADIGTNGLVGNMLVNITPVKGEAPLIKAGDYIKAKKTVEISEMIGTLANTNDKIELITQALLEITQKMNQGEGTIAQLINDRELAENFMKTSSNLAESSRQIKSSIQDISTLIDGVENGDGTLGYLFKDNSLKEEMTRLSGNLDSMILDRTVPILENLEKTSVSIKSVGEDLEKIVSDIQSEEGLINGVLLDKEVADNLKGAIKNLNDGTDKFDESMEALQHHWLLRGFFKKKEKEAKKKAEKEKKNN